MLAGGQTIASCLVIFCIVFIYLSKHVWQSGSLVIAEIVCKSLRKILYNMFGIIKNLAERKL